MTVNIFKSGSWRPNADGVWEAHADSANLDGRPPFEASCWLTRPEADGKPVWSWELYRPADDRPGADLCRCGYGIAKTLAEARRQVEERAQRWRSQPAEMEAEFQLRCYRDFSLVTCDECGAMHKLGELLTRPHCDTTRQDGRLCTSEFFDGYHLDELAEAAT